MRYLLFAFLILFAGPSYSQEAVWIKMGNIPQWGPIIGILHHPSDPFQLIVSDSSRVLAQTNDASWQTLWESRGTPINRIVSSSDNKEEFFILTNNGAYLFNTGQKTSRKVYEGRSDKSRITLSFNIFQKKWFMGTAEGVFISSDLGKTWSSVSAIPRQKMVDIQSSSEKIYLATTSSLYKREAKSEIFEKVFSLSPLERENVEFEEFSEETPASEPLGPTIHKILFKENTVWLATDRGVFKSGENETSWNLLSLSGLRSSQIQHLTYSFEHNRLFSSNHDGVFEYLFIEKRWKELHKGLALPSASDITLSPSEDSLIASTREGLFHLPLTHETSPVRTFSIPSPNKVLLLKKLIHTEPSAREVQKQVIRYSNLSNSKTKRWHWGSRASAFLPSFSFGRDFSANNNVDLDRGGASDPDKFIFGPDDIGKGWDMDLGWDFKDLIWSTAQTTIDSREKSMIELRDDFLANATRIFYERRRLQMDFVLNPPTSEKDFFERILRIDELTSLLDAITNGNFEKSLERVYAENPEFEALWEWLPETPKANSND